MNFEKPSTLLAGLIVSFSLSTSVSAAFINIDDSDLATITISAGDFEDGFSVNGNLLTTGIGGRGSITLTDGLYNISGRYLDLGQTSGRARIPILFGFSSNPAVATSGTELGFEIDAAFVTVSGLVVGFTEPATLFDTLSLPTLEQNGQTGTGSSPFLTVSFISESTVTGNPVSEPATMALMGLGLAGIAAAIRRKPAK